MVKKLHLLLCLQKGRFGIASAAVKAAMYTPSSWNTNGWNFPKLSGHLPKEQVLSLSPKKRIADWRHRKNDSIRLIVWLRSIIIMYLPNILQVNGRLII